jgi:hypothetical protein
MGIVRGRGTGQVPLIESLKRHNPSNFPLSPALPLFSTDLYSQLKGRGSFKLTIFLGVRGFLAVIGFLTRKDEKKI